MAVEGTVVGEPKLLESIEGQSIPSPLLQPCGPCDGSLATAIFEQSGRRIVQIGVSLVGDDLVQIVSDCAHVAVDRPLVVVQHHDHALGLLGYIVERLKTYAVGERSIPGKGNDILFVRARSRATAMPRAAERAVPAGRPHSCHDRFPCGGQSHSGRRAGAWSNRVRRPVSNLWITPGGLHQKRTGQKAY